MLKLNFHEGGLYVNGTQFIMFRTNYFLELLNVIYENEEPEKIKRIFRESSKIDAYLKAKEISKIQVSLLEKFKIYLETMNAVGLGEFRLKQVNSKAIVIVIENAYITRAYKNQYKKEPRISPAEIAAGYFENFAHYLLKKETRCSFAKGLGKQLLFKISIGKKVDINPIEYEYPKIKNGKMNTMTKKIILNHQIKFQKGTIQIWDIYIVLISVFFFICLTKELKIEKYKEFFKNFAKKRALNAISLQKNKFGVSTKKILPNVIKQTEIVGIGTFEKKNKIFECKNNFQEHYGKYFTDIELDLLQTYVKEITKRLSKEEIN